MGRDATGQTHSGTLRQAHRLPLGFAGFVPFGPTGQFGPHGATLGIGRKRVHERVDTPGIESGQILAALFDQGIGVLHGGKGLKWRAFRGVPQNEDSSRWDAGLRSQKTAKSRESRRLEPVRKWGGVLRLLKRTN